MPIGAGESLSSYVARCARIVRESGLPHQLTAMGTIVEGEWDEVLAVIRACHMAVRADVRRVSTLIRIDDREGPAGRLEGKIRSVEDRLRSWGLESEPTGTFGRMGMGGSGPPHHRATKNGTPNTSGSGPCSHGGGVSAASSRVLGEPRGRTCQGSTGREYRTRVG
ncbi:MAG TPA: MTH1187 family thiamine-binding protein [Candidatus Acetothermia bacterium]|nr:MTH1187 family thiamine-binding protein [Candidatus Acetothermia bacterium]